jgi:VWFA-related protein
MAPGMPVLSAMRSALATAVGMVALACTARAQFRSTVPLVVAPITVMDAKGRYIDGLTERDLLLYDNNVAQPIHLEYSAYPISLVVAVETNSNSEPAINKLGGSGILFANLIAAEGGETALISFSDTVVLRQSFTSDPEAIMRPLRNMHVEGNGACTLDAIVTAMRMLDTRKPDRRRILFLVAEKRDRSSAAKLEEAVQAVQRQNAAVYWLTYSPTLTQYTMQPKTVHWKPGSGIDPKDDGKLIENDVQLPEWNIIGALQELAHLRAPDIAALFSRVTGAHTLNFLKKSGLEEEIHAIGEEIHRQYIATFQPPHSEAGQFHTLRVEAKAHPEWQVKTREGYWAID